MKDISEKRLSKKLTVCSQKNPLSEPNVEFGIFCELVFRSTFFALEFPLGDSRHNALNRNSGIKSHPPT